MLVVNYVQLVEMIAFFVHAQTEYYIILTQRSHPIRFVFVFVEFAFE